MESRGGVTVGAALKVEAGGSKLTCPKCAHEFMPLARAPRKD